MKLRVNNELCLGSGLCAGIAAEALEMDEQGELIVLDETPPAELHEAVQQAVASCPVNALSFTEE
ncbi:ferredoxin [Streptomyces sp. NPDC058464]|uniref:ferredoxin n=1 Tax=Streptomyces sp. NPDC058464 TaxID=3346511 RepID=UPI0036689351